MLQWTVHVSFRIMVFSGYMPSSGIGGSYGRFITSLLRTLHTVFHSGCTNLHFHQHSSAVPISPHPVHFYCFFNFTILYWFCHISTWIRHRYTHIPHPEPSSLLVPSLWVVPVHQPQASSIIPRTWTGDSFHIWYYTCFNAILPNLPTLSLSHRVQKTVLYISVSFAVSYTGLLLPSF